MWLKCCAHAPNMRPWRRSTSHVNLSIVLRRKPLSHTLKNFRKEKETSVYGKECEAIFGHSRREQGFRVQPKPACRLFFFLLLLFFFFVCEYWHKCLISLAPTCASGWDMVQEKVRKNTELLTKEHLHNWVGVFMMWELDLKDGRHMNRNTLKVQWVRIAGVYWQNMEGMDYSMY